MAIDWSLYGGAESTAPPSASSTSDSDAEADADSTGQTTPSIESDQEQDAVAAGGKRRTVRLAGEKWAPRRVQPVQDPNDFLWLHTEEPHRSRRRAILASHPEVTRLMGHEPKTKYVVLFVSAVQFLTAYLLRNTPFFSWKFFLAAYAIGGTANQNVFLSIHEITHNLAFKGIRANKWFAIFANLPIGVPYAMLFKKYHLEHHKNMGEEGIDTDLPTKAELFVLSNVLGKAFFATFQIFFYALRPGFVRAQKFSWWTVANFAALIAFDALVWRFVSGTALLYFLLSSFMAGSLHPCAGHFIAEHYLFDGLDQETWSYYGPLNVLCYNVGYHQEHHDFPSVPWTRLPALRAMAHEYYDPLPAHPSWPGVTIRFIFDKNVGLWSRVKREGHGEAWKDNSVDPLVVTSTTYLAAKASQWKKTE